MENATLYQALLEREQQFRDYLETASDWYWETGADHKVTRMRDYEELRALGRLPLTSRIGLARWDFAEDVKSQPEKWELHRSMLDAHQPFRDFIFPAVRFDGSLMYVKVSGKPRFDAKGAFLGYRGTGNDVTAAVRADQAEAALRQVQAELAHVTRVTTLGELAASIAHEVNQPIAAVVTNAEAALRFLGRHPPDLEEVREGLHSIIKDANRAGDVIGRIRELMKKAPPRKDRMDINEAIHEVIELTRGEAVKSGASVQTALGEGLPLIEGDRVQLQQVALNVIINAVQAMCRRGRAARVDDHDRSSRTKWRAGRGKGHRARLGPGEFRAALRPVLHDEARRFGDGAVDLPFDRRSSWRPVVGNRQPAPGRRLSIHAARPYRGCYVMGLTGLSLVGHCQATPEGGERMRQCAPQVDVNRRSCKTRRAFAPARK